jgi:glycogen(starch) synthase
MSISVVISTYNRADSLRQTLHSLRYQTFPDFEVIVVNGPSRDGTESVLEEYDGQVRALTCPYPRLSLSRNIGLAAAAGDVVAFIDDDAIPTPHWLEELAGAYDSTGVGAVGGLVYDHTGVSLQFRYAACHRDGRPLGQVDPPLDRFTRPFADPVAYIQGTNMSFPRRVLAEVGGFDENILHFYDDVEICLRVIDRGYKLKSLDAAAVHHKFLASHIRNHERLTLDPFNQLRDRIYFALRHGRGTRTVRELMDSFLAEADALRVTADNRVRAGMLTPEQGEFHNRRLEEALEAGLAQGMGAARAGRDIPPPDPDSYLQFPVLRPAGSRLKLCFISREYPPGDFGGPGRYSHEMAAGFASFGHEVHVITRSPDHHRLDFEDGVWVHRLPEPNRLVPELDGMPARSHLLNMVAAYHEVCRIHAGRPVDLVSAPLWLCEGLVCAFDDRFPTTTTLITAMKAVATLAQWARDSAEGRQLIALEEELVSQSLHLHAVSRPILERAVADYHADASRAFIANLGLRDRAEQYRRRRPANGRVRVLYVGRIETRKGADLFLEAAVRLCREFPNAEFVLAGKEIPTDEGDTHRQRFEAQYAHDPDLRSRVTFTGLVTEEELYQHYADSDVVCLPSRYESFGLVFVEAMVFGKPVVGARAGGMVEVVADGEQGYLTPPGDAEALTDALRRLIADPVLREKFGQRSRELYEQRFSVPVTVAGCEQHFRAVIARHRGRPGWSPTAPASRETVARLLADTLTRAVGLPADRARSAADRLLDPRYHPVDHLLQMQRCWHLPPAEFITELCRIFYDRWPRQEEAEGWVRTIVASGLRRIDVVRGFLQSDEARRRGHVTDWLPDLEAVFGAGEFAAPQPAMLAAAGPAPRRSIRTRLAEARYLGKLFKYVRRAVFLPWNFHKFYHQFGTGEHIVRATTERQAATDQLIREQLIPLLQQLLARQEGLRELMWKKGEAIAAGQTELRAAIDEQVARVADTLTGIAEVVEFPPPQVNGELPHPPTPGLFRQAG